MCDCPEEQEVITAILNYHDHCWGLREICRELTDNGILCRGKPWEPVKIKRILKRQKKLAADIQ